MLNETDYRAVIDAHRQELLAHCYRMLGSFHDAEDAVQDTFLRAWRAYDRFEGRSSVRTWLYRIATRVCLTMAESRERRVLPSGLGAPDVDGNAPPAKARSDVPWLEPFPDRMVTGADPADVVGGRESMRLAFVAALQQLPARQRAALLLRDVAGIPAVEVAAHLDLSTAAVNSALQRARAQIGSGARTEEVDMNAADRELVENYMTAFENADVPALAALLRRDVELEMPPIPTWFSGRDSVVTFLAARPLRSPGSRLIGTQANGCPAIATYWLGADGVYLPHSIQVLEISGGQITHIYSFRDVRLFPVFGMPAEVDGGPSR